MLVGHGRDPGHEPENIQLHLSLDRAQLANDRVQSLLKQKFLTKDNIERNSKKVLK